MPKYIVKLDICFLEDIEVKAKNEEEAIELAYNQSDNIGNIDGVFEITKIK